MVKYIFLFCILLNVINSNAQNLDMLYELVDLGPKVNSRYHDSAPVISPDGKTLYFFRANHPENKFGTENSQDIWYCERDENGEWQEAVHMESPLNRNQFNQVMSVSSDGKTLLVRGGKGKRDPGLSLTTKSNGKWSEPTILNVEGFSQMNKGMFSGACLSSDNRVLILYFSENKEAKWSDLYVSILEGNNNYSEPIKLKPPINTTKDEFGPFLTDDMKTLYFASNRPEGFGNMDLFKTERLDDTWLNWSEPVNLGPPVNTSGFDAYFSIDATGENAFTTRAFMTADGGSLDILGLIPIPNIVLKGTIRNKENNQPLQGNLDYMAIKKDTGFVNSEADGKFEVVLHKRAPYFFQPYQDGFIGISDTLDFTKTKGDIEIEHDFYLIPKQADVLVFGKVYEENTDIPLESSISFLLGGSKVATAKSESVQGYYSTKLPGLGNYSIKIKKAGYLDGADTLTINTREDYVEIEKNLYLKPQIQLSGYVMNQKDNSTLSIQVEYKAEDGATGTFSSSNQGYYEVYLPSLGNYNFRATQEGFINLADSINIESYTSRDRLVKDLYMIPIEVGVTVRMNHIYFDFDKATLRTESYPELNLVVDFLKENATLQIEIGGHTDNQGADAYNETLSQGRADAVRSYIIEHGIDVNRVIAKGYGESQPQVSNATEEGRQTNRRVEFKVLEK